MTDSKPEWTPNGWVLMYGEEECLYISPVHLGLSPSDPDQQWELVVYNTFYSGYMSLYKPTFNTMSDAMAAGMVFAQKGEKGYINYRREMIERGEL